MVKNRVVFGFAWHEHADDGKFLNDLVKRENAQLYGLESADCGEEYRSALEHGLQLLIDKKDTKEITKDWLLGGVTREFKQRGVTIKIVESYTQEETSAIEGLMSGSSKLSIGATDSLLMYGNLSEAIKWERKSLEALAQCNAFREERIAAEIPRLLEEVAASGQHPSSEQLTMVCELGMAHLPVYEMVRASSNLIVEKRLQYDTSIMGYGLNLLVDIRLGKKSSMSDEDVARALFEKPIAGYIRLTEGVEERRARQLAYHRVCKLGMDEMQMLASRLNYVFDKDGKRGVGQNILFIGEYTRMAAGNGA